RSNTGYLLRLCNLTSDFFFSSRRRHTRFSRDWSSDVCSSDLVLTGISRVGTKAAQEQPTSRAGRSHAAPVPTARMETLGCERRRSEERRVGKEGRSRRVPEE